MEEKLGWLSRLIAQLDLDGVPLIGANAKTVVAQREATFWARDNDFHKGLARDLPSVGSALFDQLIDARPAVAVQRDPDEFRLVPQDKGEKLAQGRARLLVHRRKSYSTPFGGPCSRARRRRLVAFSLTLAKPGFLLPSPYERFAVTMNSTVTAAFLALLPLAGVQTQCPDPEELDRLLDEKLLEIKPGTTETEVRAKIGVIDAPTGPMDPLPNEAFILATATSGSRSVVRGLHCVLDDGGRLLSCTPHGGRLHIQRIDAEQFERVAKGATLLEVQRLLCTPGDQQLLPNGEILWRYSYDVPASKQPNGFVRLTFGSNGRLREKELSHR